MGYSRFVLYTIFVLSLSVNGQDAAPVKGGDPKGSVPGGKGLVYVDREGVLRWTKDHKEAAFFGVNYTVPFAYSYRAHRALGVDPEEAIRQDVYHLARLGLDAFRVHVWDTEISDSAGNLLQNEHLRLFDFLLGELSRRGIRCMITPIAFWGNGYPEKDEMTAGFSRVYGKGRATSNDTAILAQENYLRQFFRHINPYTKRTYGDDPNVIAAELNNEPSHSGPPAGVTAYINRLAAAVRSVGWGKPLYYNISQSPYYAAAVAGAAIDGVSFQWYPSGLVSGAELQGNYLPNVDRYVIPYDTIAAFRNKSRMVYEFDAADLLQSNMYPAMARSFRAAGFQWATQFAYDPMALAYANTEYQTHYLNLVYTPSKAISLLIAGRAFHELPRGRDGYGVYPVDSVFGPFRVSYRESLSEMNSSREFYYSNTTGDKPVDAGRLEHIAGVGSSPMVHYEGTGAYFLDKIGEAAWRLEVMPDAISIRDPFEKASPEREVTRIEYREQAMELLLPGLGEGFTVSALNEGNHHEFVVAAGRFRIWPGTYMVRGRAGRKSGDAGRNGDVGKNGDAGRNGDAGKSGDAGKKPEAGARGAEKMGELGMHEFVAPQPFSKLPFVAHTPYREVTEGAPFTIHARIVGLDSMDKVTVQVSRTGGWPFGGGRQGGGGGGGGFRQDGMITMMQIAGYEYAAEVPANLVMAGQLKYRIIINRGGAGKPGTGGEYIVFPGDHKGNPFAWDNVQDEEWSIFVAAKNSPLKIFDATTDRPFIIPAFRRGFQSAYVTGEEPDRLILRLAGVAAGAGTPGDRGNAGNAGSGARGDRVVGFQYAFAARLKGRMTEVARLNELVIRARTDEGVASMQAKLELIDADARAYSATITLDDHFSDIVIPVSSLILDSALVMPRPYPGFQPLWFTAGGGAVGGVAVGGVAVEGVAAKGPGSGLGTMEKVQVILEDGGSLEVQSIWLRKAGGGK